LLRSNKTRYDYNLLSTADLRNYWTELHETWWSYRYMFLVDPKVFRFVVNGVKTIFLGVQRGWWLLRWGCGIFFIKN
jgi:hypothetical protein